MRLLLAFFVVSACLTSVSAERPNVVVIMADDLGFSDLGCYGGEIATPQLDALAADGLRFTQFYNTGRCWPTRGSLLTGFYAQQIGKDKLEGVANSGNRRNRPDWAPLVTKQLATAGYRNYHVGKWHIDGLPRPNGFHRSYYLKDQHRFFSPTKHRLDDQDLEAVPAGTNYYGTVELGNRSIEFLDQHAAEHHDAPFFLYLAFAAPHFPLHALPEDIARYEGKYDAGWDKIRAERWQRVQDLGLVEKGTALSDSEPDTGPPYDFPESMQILGPNEVNRPLPWSDLTDGQKKFQATKMEIHAAMIDRMDREIGRVLDRIKAMGAFDNTLILFLSDNGASAEIMVRGDGHDPDAPMGSAASNLCLGPGWSTACNTPFRKHKTWTHEGGICTPLIAHWPAGIEAKGELRTAQGHVIDVFPTLLELAGAEVSERIPGHSLLPRFANNTAPSPHKKIWWHHDGHSAIRIGGWKLTAVKDGPWELYHLANDRTETTDLATQHPERVKEMAEAWEKTADEFRRGFEE